MQGIKQYTASKQKTFFIASEVRSRMSGFKAAELIIGITVDVRWLGCALSQYRRLPEEVRVIFDKKKTHHSIKLI